VLDRLHRGESFGQVAREVESLDPGCASASGSHAAGLDIAVLQATGARVEAPTFTSMATPISICIPHQLGRAEARRRIEGGFANLLRQLPGSAGACTERWDGDRLIFSVSGLGQTVAGVVEVLDAAVTMELELSGLLGAIASSLKGRLQEAGRLLLTRK